MTPARYATPQRLLHWLIAALVILALALIEIKGWLPKGSPERAAVKLAHAQFGLAVLLLSLVRVAARWRSTVPPISPPPRDCAEPRPRPHPHPPPAASAAPQS